MLAEVIRLILVLACAVGGAYVANYYIPPQVPKNLALILYIIIGSGIGYVIGGAAGRRVARLVIWVEEKTQRITSSELLMGVAGLILGLVIASLIALPLNNILTPALKVLSPYAVALVYVILGYLGFSTFMRKSTGIDFLPNVTLQKQKGPSNKNKILDSSVIIDSRIFDLARDGFVEGTLIVPKFVLSELQLIADSSDDMKRARGRRGLDILELGRKDPQINLKFTDQDYDDINLTDDKLVRYAKETKDILVTNDYNLGKVAVLEGVSIFNVNEMAASLRPVILPGEEMLLLIAKEGKEKNQGVAYLDDGTMVVIENGKQWLGQEKPLITTSVLQTSAGKMIFARLKDANSKNGKEKQHGNRDNSRSR